MNPMNSKISIITMQKDKQKNISQAIFAAGCFWGVEEAFRVLKGVTNTTAGYTGGTTKNPTYEEVCSDKTGHAEAVLVDYDENIISYDDLLKVFWSIHDPTQINRQGPDYGSQYRSAIFYINEDQKKKAQQSKKKLEKSGLNIATQIAPAETFYNAEEYHQKYVLKTGMNGCHI